MFIWQITLTTRQIRALQALRDMGGRTKSMAEGGDGAIEFNRLYNEALGRNFIATHRQLRRESLVEPVDVTPAGKEPIRGHYMSERITEKGLLVLKLVEMDAREMAEELTGRKVIKSKVKGAKALR